MPSIPFYGNMSTPVKQGMHISLGFMGHPILNTYPVPVQMYCRVLQRKVKSSDFPKFLTVLIPFWSCLVSIHLQLVKYPQRNIGRNIAVMLLCSLHDVVLYEIVYFLVNIILDAGY